MAETLSEYVGIRKPNLFTPDQVATFLDLPASIVGRFIASGLLEACELEPGLYRVTPAALAGFLAAHPWLSATVR